MALRYPDIDPVAISLGPVDIHWYGLMYAVGFALAWWLGRLRARRPDTAVAPGQLDDLVVYAAIGVIVGGRIGYALFYGTERLLADPLSLLRIWEGGMAFHGGLLGVILMLWVFARRSGQPFLAVGDFVAPLVPLGLGAGRLGNFINGELWGAPTSVPWGMIYPPLGPEPRHPSQLYEMALEGVVLFAVVWLFSRRPRPMGSVGGLFIAGYGCARFLVEFVRLPDAHIGYLAWGWLTMGQVLSLPMVVGGAALMLWAYRQPRAKVGAQR
ncbi:prolipoprotein diacylglyceryl transferase [Sediminicurvatus halobius]|uniref:Phosphatidylglycerol--prolipoprotein diacylglyceryl transferase n=1 Tax=Sediminicurvatus halobius TaxID=2182432 RepID=A0A2U2N1V6_9GAMM|nr:prolipoprotein diacylglyceryl transferase [Spiribacter halobius]PWG62979.1 prolipoprotein diacylglyceryl transferase [Spiribacter halobius]UEX77495.1 prolipoprotein diacylglyceryl transferase [Spiribacter halobius]